jgi:hypothetical protein
MDIQAAEAAAERQMLLRCQMLSAKKDHLIVVQRPADFGNHGAGARSRTHAPWPRTTKLYDRTGDEITLDEVERITI